MISEAHKADRKNGRDPRPIISGIFAIVEKRGGYLSQELARRAVLPQAHKAERRLVPLVAVTHKGLFAANSQSQAAVDRSCCVTAAGAFFIAPETNAY